MNFSDALKELNQGKKLHLRCGVDLSFNGYLQIQDNAIHYFPITGQVCLAQNTISIDRIQSEDWEIYTVETEVYDAASALKVESDTIAALEEQKEKLLAVLQETNKKLYEANARCTTYKKRITELTQS